MRAWNLVPANVSYACKISSCLFFWCKIHARTHKITRACTQALDTLPLEALRPEFVLQATNLRKKVTERVPIKRMSGIEIDGGMLYDLAVCYADAINAGAVPVVENAWTQVCLCVRLHIIIRLWYFFFLARLRGLCVCLKSIFWKTR
jgi:hypothetical protein